MEHVAHTGLAEDSLVLMQVELSGGCFCVSLFNAVKDVPVSGLSALISTSF